MSPFTFEHKDQTITRLLFLVFHKTLKGEIRFVDENLYSSKLPEKIPPTFYTKGNIFYMYFYMNSFR